MFRHVLRVVRWSSFIDCYLICVCGGVGFDCCVWVLFVGCLWMIVDCWIWVGGCWLLVVGCQLRVVHGRLLVVGCWFWK